MGMRSPEYGRRCARAAGAGARSCAGKGAGLPLFGHAPVPASWSPKLVRVADRQLAGGRFEAL